MTVISFNITETCFLHILLLKMEDRAHLKTSHRAVGLFMGNFFKTKNQVFKLISGVESKRTHGTRFISPSRFSHPCMGHEITCSLPTRRWHSTQIGHALQVSVFVCVRVLQDKIENTKRCIKILKMYYPNQVCTHDLISTHVCEVFLFL